jgi:MoaA/NifB/PqqE/SkfB family radical SAM enzyme
VTVETIEPVPDTPIARAVAEGRMPGRVWMYSNYHCNIQCTYCLTESGPKVTRRVLDAEAMIAIGEQAEELGFTDLGVTGGETFLMPHMPDTLAELSSHLPVVALTNGTLFTRRLLDRVEPLAERDVALQISLDRPDADANDEMRAPDNFRKVVAAVPALVERGITVRIATTVESIEDAELDRLCALHRDLGVPDSEHIIRPIVRRGRAEETGLGVQAVQADLPSELTITADGAFWGPFGPTVQNDRLDTDLLLTRTTAPLSTPANALLELLEGRPAGDDSTLNIR